MKKKSIRKWAVLAMSILLLGNLTACNASTQKALSKEENETKQEKTVTNEYGIATGHVADEVNIGFVDTSGSGVLTDTLGISRDHNFLSDEMDKIGVKINWYPMTGADPAINEALASKDLDIGSYGDVPLVNGRANNVETQLIAFNGMDTKGSLVSAPVTDYKSIRDLKGKIIATQKGSFMHRVLVEMLKAEGLTLEDINFVNATQQDAISMLVAGNIDATIASASGLTKLVSEGYHVVIDVISENPEFAASSGSAARTEFIEENPDIIYAYVKALIQAAKYAQDHPEAQQEQYETAGSTKEEYLSLFPKQDYYYSVAPVEGEIDNFKNVLTFLEENQLIAKDQAFNLDSWINSSFYEAAFQELGDEYRTIYKEKKS